MTPGSELLLDTDSEKPTVAKFTTAQEDFYLQVARNLAIQAGKIQKAALGHEVSISTKNTSIDLVTAIDRECDQLIDSGLRAECPETQVLTEEQFQEGQSVNLDNTWVVDPLDGTTNFAHGFPHFAVSIAYFHQGVPRLGVVYDVMRGEMFSVIQGRGAFLNGEALTTSKARTTTLAKSLLATGFPYDIASSDLNNLKEFANIAPRCQGVRRPGSAALDLAYVAAGRLDGYWEYKLSLWDLAVGILLVAEAGGKVTDLQTGGDIPYTRRHLHVIATNATGIHEELQTLLRPLN